MQDQVHKEEFKSENIEIPFAIITEVTSGSPSHISGLAVDDLIIEFHDVNCWNHNNLTKLAETVK